MKKSFKFLSLNFKYFLLFLLIVVASCIIPYFLIKNYNFDEKDLLSFYGAFLTFIGTFSLGYVTYIRDDRKRKEEAFDKSRLLQNILLNTEGYLFSEYTEHTKIEYDKNWHQYYYEFEFYIGYHDSELENVLNCYFKTLDNISEYISRKQIKSAEYIAKKYVEKQEYETRNYNLYDAIGIIILDLLGHPHPKKSWFNSLDIRIIINKYKKKYFLVVENWVYVYILKSKTNSVQMEDYIIDLCNWLLKYDMFKKLHKKYGRRVVCRIAYEIVLCFSKKSKKLEHYWCETSLRENNS